MIDSISGNIVFVLSVLCNIVFVLSVLCSVLCSGSTQRHNCACQLVCPLTSNVLIIFFLFKSLYAKIIFDTHTYSLIMYVYQKVSPAR